MRFLERFVAAICSALLLSLVLALIANTMEYYMIYLVYSLPIFLVGGIIFSTLADALLKRVQARKYLIALLLYTFGGIMFNFLLYVVIVNEGFSLEALTFLLIGIAASLLFLHVLMLVRKVLSLQVAAN